MGALVPDGIGGIVGTTDFEIATRYTPIAQELLQTLPENSRVAWLGQKHPKLNMDLALYNPIHESLNREDLKYDFYDIENENEENSFKWDVHERWQISGYDLVIGLRVLYLCESRGIMLKNITETVINNEKVVFDFMSGNPRTEGDTIYFEKKNESKSIIPMLTQFYPEGVKYMPKVNHQDQTVWLGDFTRVQPGTTVKLHLDNLLTFRDNTKNRFYSLCEIKEN